ETRASADSAYQAMKKVTIPEERRKVYSSIGGYPSLDGDYTVFGEVVKGLGVVDKIAAVKVDRYNRPVQDVIIKKVEVVK
ncbi:MAG: peptidylprolyl isomerase, partial [Chlorobi bacterium]|nr:peptidylprolyl isomerase [Chlorobiota bacterium]